MKLMIGLIGAGLAWLVAAAFYVQETAFQLTATRATATVDLVEGTNGSCGSRKHRYDCTRFDANLSFVARSSSGDTQYYRITVDAGSDRGRDRSISLADLRVGDKVEVLYDADDPAAAIVNTSDELHQKSRGAALFGIVSLVAGVAPSRRRRYILP